jgi:CheY-like chemotaxis protein
LIERLKFFNSYSSATFAVYMPGTIKILIADNDGDDLLFFKEALDKITDRIFELHHVQKGEEAIKFLEDCLKKNPAGKMLPDLVFLDLNMPRMDGVTCLREMKKIQGLDTIPVYVLTTSYNLEDFKKCNQLGCYGFFTKSTSVHKLSKQIEGALVNLRSF